MIRHGITFPGFEQVLLMKIDPSIEDGRLVLRLASSLPGAADASIPLNPLNVSVSREDLDHDEIAEELYRDFEEEVRENNGMTVREFVTAPGRVPQSAAVRRRRRASRDERNAVRPDADVQENLPGLAVDALRARRQRAVEQGMGLGEPVHRPLPTGARQGETGVSSGRSDRSRTKEAGAAMCCHFLMDWHRWTLAALHHFEAWEREEREIFARMVPRVTHEGIALAGAYYSVARHFPKDRRQALIGIIESVVSVEGEAERRFDGFVRSVRSLAKGVATAPAEGDRALRPISGMSKFLWYRIPVHGFIYDSRVLAAVCSNGLTVRFDAMIDDFGGRPSDSGEWNFLIAAASYRTFALPLHALVAEVFEDSVYRLKGLQG
jgi:hypothetical protein